MGAATAKVAQTEVPVAPLAGRVIIDWISTVWSRERKKIYFLFLYKNGIMPTSGRRGWERRSIGG